MKTLIFNGSPSKSGDTAALIKHLLCYLSGEYRIVNCYYDNISPCIDCRFCRENSGCAIDDDMQQIYRYIEECDNIVIASPIYFSQPTGKLLDVGSRLQTYFTARFFRKETPITKAKKGAVILAGGGSLDPKDACKTAEILLSEMNVTEVFPLICSHNTDKVPAAEDKKALDSIVCLAGFLNGH